MVAGKLTFWGCYLAIRDQLIIQRGWSVQTAREYESSYINKICRNLRNHDQTPITAYTYDDYAQVIKAIKKAGYTAEDGKVRKYDQITLDRFHYLIRAVVQTAAANYLCYNVFDDGKSNHALSTRSKKGKIIPRSMSADAEARLATALLTDPMQYGQYMGLACMYCLGLRNAEACGLNFGDIRLWQDAPDLWVAWVYKTTKIGSSMLQASGKTKNADRVIPLPELFVRLVIERKRMLQQLLGPDVDVDALPIACKGDRYCDRCSADDITTAARTFFEEIGVASDQIHLAYQDMNQELEPTDAQQPEDDPIDKDPTAYFLRRLCVTALVCLGMTSREIAYYIGHDMGDNIPELRNEFLTTENLLKIKAKLSRRALVNTSYGQPNAVVLSSNTATTVTSGGDHELILPQNTSSVTLHLTTREPQDTVAIGVHTGERMVITCSEANLSPTSYPKELDVMHDYHTLFDNHDRKG